MFTISKPEPQQIQFEAENWFESAKEATKEVEKEPTVTTSVSSMARTQFTRPRDETRPVTQSQYPFNSTRGFNQVQAAYKRESRNDFAPRNQIQSQGAKLRVERLQIQSQNRARRIDSNLMSGDSTTLDSKNNFSSNNMITKVKNLLEQKRNTTTVNTALSSQSIERGFVNSGEMAIVQNDRFDSLSYVRTARPTTQDKTRFKLNNDTRTL